jgi:protein O-mannosyl-transferase
MLYSSRGMFRPRTIALLLGLITLLAYAPATRHSFLNLDDDLFVTDNHLVQKGFTLNGVAWALRTFHESMWHPVSWLSHMLDCQLFGLNPSGHHFTNVFLHAVNVLLLFWLLWKLTGDLWPSAFVAALFAWHPLSVESAAWIAERKNVLCTFFGLLTLLAYTSYAQKRLIRFHGVHKRSRRREGKANSLAGPHRANELAKGFPSPHPMGRGPTGEGSIHWRADSIKGPHRPPHLGGYSAGWDYALALVFFALCLMSKTMLVTLPCIMLLLDYWPLQRLPPSGFSLRQFLRLAFEKLPFFLLLIPACVLTVRAESHGGLLASWERLPLDLRVWNAFRAYVLYLWKAICPLKLTILYPYPPRELALVGILSAALLVALSLLVVRARRQFPYLFVGWLWYLGTLVPLIGIIQTSAQAMNDHHAYATLLGIYIAVAFGIKDLLARFHIGVVPPAVTAGLVLGSCLVLTERQLGYWRDDETVFTHALAITENNGAAHNNLGVALAKQGRRDEARVHFQKAVDNNPLWADPHNNLGNVLFYSGQFDDALREYTAAARLKPRLPAAHYNAGRALAKLGRIDEAFGELNQAAELNPNYPWPHFEIARILLEQGRDSEAIEQLREAVRIAPREIQILTFTAHVLAADENPALRDGKTALTLAMRAASLSADPEVLDVLGIALAETGDFANAQTVASNAVELATAAKQTNLDPLRQRLECYKKQQPWHESFRGTNAPPKQSSTN